MTRPPPDIEPIDEHALRAAIAAESRRRAGSRALKIGLAALFAAAWLVATVAALRAETLPGAALRVVDGDTLRHPSGEVIRLRNIDAPETTRARCPEEAALGARAAARLRELLARGPVEIRRCPALLPSPLAGEGEGEGANPTGAADRRQRPLQAWRCTDIYERTLATIHDAEGRDLGEQLIREGLATPWPKRFAACPAER